MFPCIVASTNTGIWDNFWAVHATRNSLFHRLLWQIRRLFSTAYATGLTRAIGNLADPRLIEVGCGSAQTLRYLDAHYSADHCVGLDWSRPALTLSKAMQPSFSHVLGDCEQLPIASGQFDLSCSVGLIEHFPRAGAMRICREKVRITREGGRVAVVVPWRNSFYNRVVRTLFGRYWPFGEEDPFRRAELRLMMEQLGLEDVSVQVVLGTTLLAIGTKARQGI